MNIKNKMLCGQPELIQYAKEIPYKLDEIRFEIDLEAPMPPGGLNEEEELLISIYKELTDIYENYQNNFKGCTQIQILNWYNYCKEILENNIVKKIIDLDYEDVDFELILGEEY